MKKGVLVLNLLLLLLGTGAFLGMAPAAQAWYGILAVTLLHCTLGLILVLGIGPYLWFHLRSQGQWATRKTRSLAIFFLLGGTIISGGLLLYIGQRGRLGLLHDVFSLGLVGIIIRHIPVIRFQRLVIANKAKFYIPGTILLLIALAPVLFNLQLKQPAPAALQSFAPASMQVEGRVAAYHEPSMGTVQCAQCHKEIVSQWKQSMHSMADTEIIYARVVGEFRRQYGVEASNWCAGCHSPLRLARNQVNIKVADVPQANVECLTCHSMQEVGDPIGNNNFVLNIKEPTGYEVASPGNFENQLLLIQPDAHRMRWNGEMVKSPEFCGACHNQKLPSQLAGGGEGVQLQGTYDEWRTTGYNTPNEANRKTCQTCHMPREAGFDGGLGAKPPSHYFIGASVDIPRIAGAREFNAAAKKLLASAATLTFSEPTCTNGTLGIQVKVTNSGAGHNLPTGVTDLRQMWLHVIATDEHGMVLYESGYLDAQGFVDPGATRFGVTLGDEAGNPVRLHDIARVRQILTDTTIPAGQSREAAYRIPTSETSKLQVEAKLLYQSVPQDLINHYMTPDLRFETVPMAVASTMINIRHVCN